MAKESGVEYNPETADHLRPKDFCFDAYGILFRFTLQIPHYIMQRLDSATLEKLQVHMDAHAAGVVASALKGGYVHTTSGETAMRADVGAHLKNYIWERFSIAQEQEGNSCWATAPSLQEVRL